jgi:hypothetical protein
MINQCFEIQPRFLLIDEIEDLRQSDQASLLSLMQDVFSIYDILGKKREGRFSQFICTPACATCDAEPKTAIPNPPLIKAPIIAKIFFRSFSLGTGATVTSMFIYMWDIVARRGTSMFRNTRLID